MTIIILTIIINIIINWLLVIFTIINRSNSWSRGLIICSLKQIIPHPSPAPLPSPAGRQTATTELGLCQF